MKPSTKKQTLNRINYICGHLEGVKKMIEKDKYCIEVITQNNAIIAAIKKLNQIILEGHLNTCVTKSITEKDIREKKKKLKELLDIFKNKE